MPEVGHNHIERAENDYELIIRNQSIKTSEAISHNFQSEEIVFGNEKFFIPLMNISSNDEKRSFLFTLLLVIQFASYRMCILLFSFISSSINISRIISHLFLILSMKILIHSLLKERLSFRILLSFLSWM